MQLTPATNYKYIYLHDNLGFRDSFAAGIGRQPCHGRLITTCFTLIMTTTTAAATSFSVREATERDCDEIIRMVKVSRGRLSCVLGLEVWFLCISLSRRDSEIPGTDSACLDRL